MSRVKCPHPNEPQGFQFDRGVFYSAKSSSDSFVSASAKKEELVLNGPVGNLQAIFERPSGGKPMGGAVVCHPHPQHGGAMQNKVTHTLARAFVSCGLAALRFNFRGVGKSDGEFAEGHGELLDALAAAKALRDRIGSGPLWFAGFSFGAAIAIQAAQEVPTQGLISVAPAISRVSQNRRPQPGCPWLILQGERDELVPLDDTLAWVNVLDPGPELQIFPDTGHFFHGKLVALRAAVTAFVEDHRL